MRVTIVSAIPGAPIKPVEIVSAPAAPVHELEALNVELEEFHEEFKETLDAVERQCLQLIRGLQQTIGQHLADHPQYPARGRQFAKRARQLLAGARRQQSGAGRIVGTSKILEQLVEEAWVQL